MANALDAFIKKMKKSGIEQGKRMVASALVTSSKNSVAKTLAIRTRSEDNLTKAIAQEISFMAKQVLLLRVLERNIDSTRSDKLSEKLASILLTVASSAPKAAAAKMDYRTGLEIHVAKKLAKQITAAKKYSKRAFGEVNKIKKTRKTRLKAKPKRARI